jgi:hypothetical protein
MKGIIYMVEHDFRNFFRYKWWLVGLISMNLADLFISAIVYNMILNPSLRHKSAVTSNSSRPDSQ